MPIMIFRCMCSSMADVALTKRHQRLDESLIFLPVLYMKSANLFVRKLPGTRAFITRVCCMKQAHYSKRMLCEQDCVKFSGHIAWHILLENNFADFSDAVRVKKYQAFAQPLSWWRFVTATSAILTYRATIHAYLFSCYKPPPLV